MKRDFLAVIDTLRDTLCHWSQCIISFLSWQQLQSLQQHLYFWRRKSFLRNVISVLQSLENPITLFSFEWGINKHQQEHQKLRLFKETWGSFFHFSIDYDCLLLLCVFHSQLFCSFQSQTLRRRVKNGEVSHFGEILMGSHNCLTKKTHTQ